MRQELIELANKYKQAGDAIHDAIKKSVADAGGFINCSTKPFSQSPEPSTNTFNPNKKQVSPSSRDDIYYVPVSFEVTITQENGSAKVRYDFIKADCSHDMNPES